MSTSKNGGYVATKDYEEYTTARGVTLRISPVPQPIIRSIVPNTPKPEIPMVEMQLPKGPPQKRPLKKTDPGWEEYEASLKAWEDERDELQEAVTYCFAIKGYEFPDNLEPSPEIKQLIELGFLKVSDNPFIKKFMWMRENLLGQHDEYNINMIIHKLSGVPEDIIDEMKRNFRNILLGSTSSRVGKEDGQQPRPEEAETVDEA